MVTGYIVHSQGIGSIKSFSALVHGRYGSFQKFGVLSSDLHISHCFRSTFGASELWKLPYGFGTLCWTLGRDPKVVHGSLVGARIASQSGDALIYRVCELIVVLLFMTRSGGVKVSFRLIHT